MQYKSDVMLEILPNFLVGTHMKDNRENGKQLSSEPSDIRLRVRKPEIVKTEYKRTEETSHEGEKRFRKIFEHSNDAILVIDVIQDEILDVNSKACKMLGYSRQELLSMPISAIHSQEMPKLLAFAKSVSRNGDGWTDQLSCLTRAGQLLPTEISASIIDIFNRSCMIALVRDISERKQVEETLRESEERFRRLVEYAADAFFLLDRAGRVLDVNRRACESLGYTREELLGLSVSDIEVKFEAEALADVRKEIVPGVPVTLEGTHRRKDGTTFPVEIRVGLVELGGVQHQFALARDLTELRRKEQELHRANERMKSDLEAAARIQESLLPKVPPDVAGVSFAWAFKPCDELAGDILNVFLLDDKQVGLYVLDVSGHGVAAALLSQTLNRFLSPDPSSPSVLKQCIEGSRYGLLSPAEVAEQLNKQFPMDPVSRQYFTLLYGMLNSETREFRYVSAGHPGPVYLSRAAEPVILEAPGFPIGFFEGVKYEEHSLSMKPGDRLYLYSDGITEAMNAKGEQFGKGRLIKALKKNRNAPLKDSLSSLLEDVEEWSPARVEDDISILAVEIAE